MFCFEHGVDATIQQQLHEAFGIWDHIDTDSPTAEFDKLVATNQFLGLEMVRVFPTGTRILFDKGMHVSHERGPVSTWAEFKAFDWPRAEDADLRVLEHLEKTLPTNMRAMHVMSLWEEVRELFGYETFCYCLYDQPDLVDAMVQTVGQLIVDVTERVCDFDCYGAVYLSDDLGHKTGLMISPEVVRRLFMPWHKKVADVAHAHGKLMFFHSCGQMYELMDEYIDHVQIDAKHSYEEQIVPVTEMSRRWGDRVGVLGGMDVDFLARADEEAIRAKTRQILETCLPVGGYFLGSGNWVTSYIPLQNYLAMLDEGRRYRV